MTIRFDLSRLQLNTDTPIASAPPASNLPPATASPTSRNQSRNFCLGSQLNASSGTAQAETCQRTTNTSNASCNDSWHTRLADQRQRTTSTSASPCNDPWHTRPADQRQRTTNTSASPCNDPWHTRQANQHQHSTSISDPPCNDPWHTRQANQRRGRAPSIQSSTSEHPLPSAATRERRNRVIQQILSERSLTCSTAPPSERPRGRARGHHGPTTTDKSM